jgi:hypothetical protein
MESIQRDDLFVRDADAPVKTADPVVTADPVEVAAESGTETPAETGQPRVDPAEVVVSDPEAVAEKIEPHVEDQKLGENLEPEGREVIVNDTAEPVTANEPADAPAAQEADLKHLAVPSDPPSARERAQAEGYYGTYSS